MGITIDNCGNIYPNIIDGIVEQVTETHEKFIFETIKPFCESVVEMEISKEDLTHALLLWKYYDKRLKCDMLDVLNKISVEIDQKQYDFMADKDYDEGIRFGLMLAYQIIDKYKKARNNK